MNAHHIAQGNGEQSIGIVLLQIGLAGEGQAGHIVEAAKLVWVDLAGVELLSIEGHVHVDARQDRLELFELQLAQLVPLHAFLFRLPDHDYLLMPSSSVSESKSRPR